jgi:hypothetical protein
VAGGRWLAVGRRRAAKLSYEQRGGWHPVARMQQPTGSSCKQRRREGGVRAVGRDASRGGEGSVRQWDGGGRREQAPSSGGESRGRRDASKMRGPPLVGGKERGARPEAPPCERERGNAAPAWALEGDTSG